MVEINNLTFTPIDEKFFKKLAHNVLKGEGKKNFELSIALVGQKRIRRLNKQYLGRDYSTDVLSFPGSKEINFLGEIVICSQEVKKNAERFNLVFKKELARVLIHGILHLLGYEHEKSLKQAGEMREKEDYYFKKMF